MSSTEHVIELPNRWGRRYRVVHLGTRYPVVFVEVFTASRKRVWRVLPSNGKRQKERAAVLAHVEGRVR